MKTPFLLLALAALPLPAQGLQPFTGVMSENGDVTVGGEMVNQQTQTSDWSAVTSVEMFDALWNSTFTLEYVSPAAGVGYSIGEQSIPDYWDSGATFEDGTSDIASFDVTSASVQEGATFFDVNGTGIAYLTGYAATQATWTYDSYSTDDLGPSYGWGTATFVATGVPYVAPVQTVFPQDFGGFEASVPDGTSTALLLGIAICILSLAPVRVRYRSLRA